MVRIPTHGPPTHPGEMILEEFLHPLQMTQTELAERLGVDRSTVSRDLQAVRQQWVEAATADYDTALGEELACLGEIERQAWVAWFKSQDGGPGNPRFLALIGRTAEQRARLLALGERRPDREEADKPLDVASLVMAAERGDRPVIIDEAYVSRLYPPPDE